MRGIFRKAEYTIDALARFLLSIIFIVLGLTKIAGQAETELITKLLPVFAGASPLFWIGLTELIGGIVILFRRFYRIAIVIFSVYLVLLLFILFKEYSALFTQNIFSLTNAGDKLVRTIGLVAGALVLLISGRKFD
jgi:uncharacterized membrane protein YphA (DoxX/SURF4 family)